ncbi:putative alpha-L-fucosidase-like [Tropilaelaps mercedesae]|uniref:Putative alpha-L-fucosidase-like n=1 Tax=Tropilaelaps mercedesae TaxID=418985 RepID=A0A1V9Y2K2_9ACAR|nr:putative alpha-L-fucosidase-like [Tropilaelaps mercedesae]
MQEIPPDVGVIRFATGVPLVRQSQDGDWDAATEYRNVTSFSAWLYNNSPVKDSVLVNDRGGINITCKHGDFYNCKDQSNPGVLLPHKWENAMRLDRKSWWFRPPITSAVSQKRANHCTSANREL